MARRPALVRERSSGPADARATVTAATAHTATRAPATLSRRRRRAWKAAARRASRASWSSAGEGDWFVGSSPAGLPRRRGRRAAGAVSHATAAEPPDLGQSERVLTTATLVPHVRPDIGLASEPVDAFDSSNKTVCF